MMLTTIPAKTIISNNFEFLVIVYLLVNINYVGFSITYRYQCVKISRA